jgi:hypothetical protein
LLIIATCESVSTKVISAKVYVIEPNAQESICSQEPDGIEIIYITISYF